MVYGTWQTFFRDWWTHLRNTCCLHLLPWRHSDGFNRVVHDWKSIAVSNLIIYAEIIWRKNGENARLFQNNIDWLGFNVSEVGVQHLLAKSDAIESLRTPKNIYELQSIFTLDVALYDQFLKPTRWRCTKLKVFFTLSSVILCRPVWGKKSSYHWNEGHSDVFKNWTSEIVYNLENIKTKIWQTNFFRRKLEEVSKHF